MAIKFRSVFGHNFSIAELSSHCRRAFVLFTEARIHGTNITMLSEDKADDWITYVSSIRYGTRYSRHVL